MRCLLADSGLSNIIWAEITFNATYLANRTPSSAINLRTRDEALHGIEATLRHLRSIDSRASYTSKRTGKQVLVWQALRVQPGQQGVPYLQRHNTQSGGGQEHRIHPQTIEDGVSTDQQAGQHRQDGKHWHNRFHDGPEDHDVLRDVRDHTSRIGFNNDETYDHIIPIAQLHDTAIAKILNKTHGQTQGDVLERGETPGGPADSVDRQLSPTDDDGGQHKMMEAYSEENPLEIVSNSGGVLPQHRETPAMTRISSRADSALILTAALRELQQSRLCTNTALPDMAHHMKMLTYAEYAYAVIQLQRSDRGDVVPNTFKEAAAYPETARWNHIGQGNG